MDALLHYQSLIRRSLDLSPLARATHDTHYKAGFYKYAETPDSQANDSAHVRYIANNDFKDIKLVFRSQGHDAVIIRSMQHELTHIEQLAQAKAQKVPIDPFDLKYDDYLALRLVWEAQAFANNTEGPVMGVLKSLQENRTEDLRDYKTQFAEERRRIGGVDKEREIFLTAFFNKKPAIQDSVDSIAYEFYNSSHLWDAETLEKQKLNGRKAMIKNFFRIEAMQNNLQLDNYIEDISDSYNLNNKIKVEMLKNLHSMYGTQQSTAQLQKKDDYFQSILKTTVSAQGSYLSEQDWIETLGVDSTAELANRVMFFSRHKHNAVIQQKRNFNFKL